MGGDIGPVIYVVTKSMEAMENAGCLLDVDFQKYRIYKPAGGRFPLSHVDSTSSRVFDRQQGANILQQTIGRPLSGIVFDEAICTMLLTMP